MAFLNQKVVVTPEIPILEEIAPEQKDAQSDSLQLCLLSYLHVSHKNRDTDKKVEKCTSGPF